VSTELGPGEFTEKSAHYHKMVRSVTITVQKHSWEGVVQQEITLYQNLLRSQTG